MESSISVPAIAIAVWVKFHTTTILTNDVLKDDQGGDRRLDRRTASSKIVATRERSPVQTRGAKRRAEAHAFAQLTACEPEGPVRKLRLPKLEEQLAHRRQCKPIHGLRFSDHVETCGRFLDVRADTEVDSEEEFHPQTFKRWRSGVLRQDGDRRPDLQGLAARDRAGDRACIGQTTAKTQKCPEYDSSRDID